MEIPKKVRDAFTLVHEKFISYYMTIEIKAELSIPRHNIRITPNILSFPGDFENIGGSIETLLHNNISL